MRNSQYVRQFGPEADPLWLGKGCRVDDLAKAQIMIETTHGDSHPGSKHMDQIANAVRDAVYAAGAMPSVYTTTDICDGVATGHRGMNYSLISRNMIAGMVEIHASASGYDGMVTSASCDKAVPGQLMAIARMNIPSVFIPGGSMAPGPNFITADSCYETNMRVAEGNMTQEEQLYVQLNACMSCGACQYMGTASTMQCMAESLGMALPGSAIAPANTNVILHLAAAAGKRVAEIIANDEKCLPLDILTKDAFINAIKIHAAIGGSTNAVLHLPAIAKEAGIELKLSDFEEYTREIPLLTSIMTAGKWPTQYLWQAGGIPAIMRELKDHLNLDVMTVTGHTIRENLEMLEKSGFFRRADEMMRNMNFTVRDIIKSVDAPVDADSGVSILHGNIAAGGAVIKHCAVDKSMYHFTGKARIFEDEESAVAAIYEDRINPGDVVIVRYVGVKAKGMPEMLKATDAICNKPNLLNSTAIVTDGRFSGATRGPSVGYLLPEAAEGGEIGLIHEGDIIEINIPEKQVNVIGLEGVPKTPEEVAAAFAERRKTWEPKKFERRGVLKYLDIV